MQLVADLMQRLKDGKSQECLGALVAKSIGILGLVVEEEDGDEERLGYDLKMRSRGEPTFFNVYKDAHHHSNHQKAPKDCIQNGGDHQPHGLWYTVAMRQDKSLCYAPCSLCCVARIRLTQVIISS